MSRATGEPSRQDVLDAFAVEPDTGRATLERYLRDYPQFATELLDLSRMLASPFWDEETPLSSEDRAKIDAAWLRHAAAVPNPVADPFSSLSPRDHRKIAERLGVPRQVLTALRHRRVILSTVPGPFLARPCGPHQHLARSNLSGFCRSPPLLEPARSYSSERKPVTSEAVSFEQVLIDADVPEDKRAELMSGAA